MIAYLTSMVILLATLFIPLYAIIYMVGGPGRASAFAKWVRTKIRNSVTGILQWVGRQVADVAHRNPMTTGITALGLLLWFLYWAGAFR